MKWSNDGMLDAGLNWIKTNCANICICSQQPTTFAEANATYMLARGALAEGDFGNPVNGDESGRKIVVPSVADISVTNTGDENHVALISADTLLYVTTSTQQTLTAGNTVTTPAWDIELEDPTQ